MKEVASSHEVVRFGLFEADFQTGELRKSGFKIRLQDQPFHVLQILLDHPGELVTREELQRQIWPADTFVDFEKGLNNAIKRLREGLGDSSETPRFIETIPRRGYRFIGSVTPAKSAEPTPAGVSAAGAHAGVAGPFTYRRLAIGLVLLLAFLGTLLGFDVGGVRRRVLAKAGPPAIHSLAVLPLANLSNDPNQEYFSDGMTDFLITDLAQIASVKVISRTSSMQYKQTTKSLPEIARELSVDGIVEGSIQRSGERVRITAQLIHGPSDRHIWANSYEGDVRDSFALERNVTEDITRQVQARLVSQSQMPRAQPGSTNPKALEAYLQGNYHLSKYGRGSGGEELEKAAEWFQQAIDADPNFARAYIGLASTHGVGPVSSREDWELQRKAAEKALTLDPNSSEAWTIVVGFGGEDYAGTRAEQTEQGYRHALELYPNSVEARDGLCGFLAEMGRLDEALRECQIAQELDPNNDHLGIILYERGEYDRAIQILRMMIERHPDDGLLHYVLFQVFVKKQNYPDAIQELEKALTAYGLSDAAAKVHHSFAISGYRAAMQQAAKEVEHLQAENRFYIPVNLADFYAMLGDKDRAFYWLEQAYVHREMIAAGESATYIGVDPMLVPLRSDARFKDLVRRIGLPP